MKINTRPEADAEQRDAARRLEKARRGYGWAFYDAYDVAVADIATMPYRFPPADDAPDRVEVREAYLAKYKYRIVFAVLPAEVVVLAVAHAHRRPGYWHTRLTEPT